MINIAILFFLALFNFLWFTTMLVPLAYLICSYTCWRRSCGSTARPSLANSMAWLLHRIKVDGACIQMFLMFSRVVDLLTQWAYVDVNMYAWNISLHGQGYGQFGHTPKNDVNSRYSPPKTPEVRVFWNESRVLHAYSMALTFDSQEPSHTGFLSTLKSLGWYCRRMKCISDLVYDHSWHQACGKKRLTNMKRTIIIETLSCNRVKRTTYNQHTL